jgi:hypothetical protein
MKNLIRPFVKPVVASTNRAGILEEFTLPEKIRTGVS